MKLISEKNPKKIGIKLFAKDYGHAWWIDFRMNIQNFMEIPFQANLRGNVNFSLQNFGS